MLKLKYARTVACAHLHVWGSLMVLLLGFSFNAGAITSGTNSPAIQRSDVGLPSLDAKHLFALGMIETGNDDYAIGRAGEISRYQLRPTVWRTYSTSSDYRNPNVSLLVARQHWLHLAACFRETTGRNPDDFDMYVLWNTGYGYYARKGFSKNHVAPVVKDRAQRFVNLVNRKDQ